AAMPDLGVAVGTGCRTRVEDGTRARNHADVATVIPRTADAAVADLDIVVRRAGPSREHGESAVGNHMDVAGKIASGRLHRRIIPPVTDAGMGRVAGASGPAGSARDIDVAAGRDGDVAGHKLENRMAGTP